MSEKPTRKDLIEILDMMITTIEELPPNAMTVAITHYDYLSMLMVFSELFKSFDGDNTE